MKTSTEIVIVAAAAIFALWLALVATRSVSERLLVSTAALFGVATLAAGVGLAVSLLRGDGDWRAYGVALASLAALTAGQIGLVSLNRLRARDMRLIALVEQAFEHVDERIESHAKQRAKELEHTLARERAHSQHALVDQERELAKARLAAIAQAEQASSDDLLRRIAAAQDQLSARVMGWAADLERAQSEQASRIEQQNLAQRSELSAQRDELDEHTRMLRSLTDERASEAEKIRDDFSGHLATLAETLHKELELEDQQFRREVAQLSERLKAVAQSLRDDAYREELDARTRLASDISAAERRVLTSFEKSLERAAGRVAETSERRFDEQIRESREETASRLAGELERTRDAYARQIEEGIENRMQEVAQQTTQRLQRQLDEVVRQAESQTSSTEDRITFITQRLEAAMDTAAGRVAAFESGLELELSTKLTEFERAVRHAEQSVGREAG